MLNRDFFNSPVWRQLVLNFTKTNNIPAPVLEFTLVDGTSFNVKGIKAFRTCIITEMYNEQSEIQLRLLPYENIKYVTIKKGAADNANTLNIPKIKK